MGQHHFRYVKRGVSSLGNPVSEAGAETMRPCGHLAPFHQTRHSGIGNDAFLHAREKVAITCERLGLLDDGEGFRNKRNAEIWRLVFSPLLLFAGDCLDIALNLLLRSQ